MYLNMDDHTEALDFVFTLLDWDRTTDFIIKKETIDKERLNRHIGVLLIYLTLMMSI